MVCAPARPRRARADARRRALAGGPARAGRAARGGAERLPPRRRLRPHARGARRGRRDRADPGAAASASTPSAVAALLAEPLADELTRGAGDALRRAAARRRQAADARASGPTGGSTFIGHDSEGAELARAVLRRLRASERLADYVAGAHPPPPPPRLPRPRGRRSTPRTAWRYLRATEPYAADVTILTVADRLATRGRNAEPAIAAHLELARAMLAHALADRAAPRRPPLIRGDELAAELGIRPGPAPRRAARRARRGPLRRRDHDPRGRDPPRPRRVRFGVRRLTQLGSGARPSSASGWPAPRVRACMRGLTPSEGGTPRGSPGRRSVGRRMYQVEAVRTLVKPGSRARTGARVSRNVVLLGATSLLTDISSEMVGDRPAAVRRLRARRHAAAVRRARRPVQRRRGARARRRRVHRPTAASGTRRSRRPATGCRAVQLGLLLVGRPSGCSARSILLDRIGKGIRTAPRDALITLSTPRDAARPAFGVHRAMDTVGAMLGPLVAFGILRARAAARSTRCSSSRCASR